MKIGNNLLLIIILAAHKKQQKKRIKALEINNLPIERIFTITVLHIPRTNAPRLHQSSVGFQAA